MSDSTGAVRPGTALRRVIGLRAALLALSAAIVLAVVLPDVVILAGIVPQAAEMNRRTVQLRTDFLDRATTARELSAVQDALHAALHDLERPGAPGAAAATPLRERLEGLAIDAATLRPVAPPQGANVMANARIERADFVMQALLGTMLGAAAAIELRDATTARALTERADTLSLRLTETIEDVTAAALADVVDIQQDLAAQSIRNRRLALGAVLTVALLLLWAGWLVQRRFFGPLAVIDAALDRIGTGDLSVAVPLTHDDEVGRVASHLNRATAALRWQRDAVAQDAARAATAASDARYRAAFEQSAVGLAEWTIDGRFVHGNAAFALLVGRPLEDIGATADAELVSPDDRDDVARTWAAIADGTLQWVRSERHYRRPDGSVARAVATLTLLREPDGTPGRVLSVVLDVTEQHRLQRELLERLKLDAVGQLAGGVAHDFNNLLTGVMGSAELIAEDPTLSADGKDETAAILHAARRGGELARSLLALGRRSGDAAVPFALGDAVQDALVILRRTVGPAIAIESAIAPATLLGDRARLSNALLNLGVNARDAMPDGGTLTFRAAPADPSPAERTTLGLRDARTYVAVTVTDTGTGIPPELRERIFEPFFTTKPVGQGTGLGLALVYAAVKDLGGAVTVDSTPGRGTTFTLLLPAA